MDIYSYLRKDHIKVSNLFDDAIAARDQQKQEEIYDNIKKELLLHAETEQATFYDTLKDYESMEDEIGHAEDEHDDMKKFMAKIDRISIDSKKWLEQLKELRDVVKHHVDEEEGKIFEGARKVLNEHQAEDLAVRMEALKRKKHKNAA